MQNPLPIQRLLDELERLPGVGPKSAMRIAYAILAGESERARALAEALVEVKEVIHFCPRCFNFTEGQYCEICNDSRRDTHQICVVEEPRDVSALEKTGEYNGLYHVLHGAISPLDGIGPDELRIKELMTRLGDNSVTEVVIATNPTIEGESTAAYLARAIKPLGIKVTRIASGLPVGGDLEYADEVTLGRALEARREM